MSTATKPWVYDGPYDGVDIKLVSGRWITVQRGDEIDLLPNEAKALKNLPGWSPVKTTTPSTDNKERA